MLVEEDEEALESEAGCCAHSEVCQNKRPKQVREKVRVRENTWSADVCPPEQVSSFSFVWNPNI